MEPSQLSLSEYEFVFEDEGRCYVKFGKIETNKEWFNILAGDFLINRAIPLPTEGCGVVKMFLG